MYPHLPISRCTQSAPNNMQIPTRLFNALLPLPLILYALSFLFFSLCQGAPPCPKCGNITVPYPLSTSPSCGDQQYKVVCNSSEGKLSLNTQSGNYPIVMISPTSQTLAIGSPAITPVNTCATSDLSSGGFVLDNSIPFNVTSNNTLFLLNCSDIILRYPLDCTSTSLCTKFLAQDSRAKPCANKLCCTLTTGGSATSHKIGVIDCTAYVSVLGTNLDNLPVKEWNYGIELEWKAPSEPVCSSQADCDSLSTCKWDSASNARRCMCNEGYQWNDLAGTCTDKAWLCAADSLHCEKKQPLAPRIAGIVIGILVCCVLALTLLAAQRRRRAVKEASRKLSKERQLILSEGSGGRSAKLYTSQEMKKATENFDKKWLLGSGGFGDVYKGVLEDGTIVAVKSAKVGNTKGIDQVLNEVRILSQVNHRGLVRLLGCCVETEQPLLVYEFIVNGTLLDHLKGDHGTFLDWQTRLKVAMQTAEGLAYLHSSANPPIYHRDVKSSNILLDAELNAKVSDFGLSRLAQADLSHISTCAQGTIGYMDPEYYRNFQLTAKSDVYSFGVVLLELVTSQRAIEFMRGEGNVNLASYVARKADEARVMEVVDPRLLECSADTALMLGTVGTASAVGSESSSMAFNSSSTANFSTSSPVSLLQNAMSVQSHHQEGGNGSRDSTSVVGAEAAVAESIYKVVCLALSCLQDSHSCRPSMKEVAEALQCSLQALKGALGDGSGLHSANNGLTAGLSGISADCISEGTSGLPSWASGPIVSFLPPHAIPR